MARRYVPVAEVARPHGVHGELRLKVYNQDSDLLLCRPAVKLQLEDGSQRDVTIQSVRDVSKAILMKFAGVDDRDAAEALRGAKVAVARDAFPSLAEGEFYACDLEGARALLPSGEEVGRVVGLESYPTCDVLLIDRAMVVPDGAAGGSTPRASRRRPGQRIEIPLVEAYVASIDVDRGVVELVTIEGLG
jgi:16S rRNA processing protein RimM